MGVALKIRLRYREGCARSAVRCLHQDPPGASPPTRPTGHLRLFEPKFLLGAQPSLVRNLRGLGSLWRFLKSRLAETMESEANRKGGYSHNPGASQSPPRTLPSHPNRVPDGVAGFQTVSELVDWHRAGTRQPGDRGPHRAGTSQTHWAVCPGPFRLQASGGHFVQPPEAERFFKEHKLFSVVL